MSQHRGSPGSEGQPGKPGSEGKDSGEGGRGGEGGEGGVGGKGAPQGPGGVGGEGGEGGRGARGRPGPPGERGEPGPQPKLRWAPAVGYVLVVVFFGSLGVWNYSLSQKTSRLAEDNRYLITQVANTCTDPKASAALRTQWARVAEIIDGTQNTKKGEPGYIPPEQASKLFAQSYKEAIREAGPAPDCRGLVP